MTSVLTPATTPWPADEAIAAERVLAGAPAAATIVTSTSETTDTGLWRVSEGEFTTVHVGYVEFIHVVEGEGDLVHDDDTVIPLAPGTTVTMADGWSGRWVIRQRLTKAFAIVRAAA